VVAWGLGAVLRPGRGSRPEAGGCSNNSRRWSSEVVHGRAMQAVGSTPDRGRQDACERSRARQVMRSS
jgi:hypothetical protein